MITLGFTMTTNEYVNWSQWMFDNGAQWFNIPLDRYGGSIQTGEVRLTGPWTPRYRTFDRIDITAPAELREQPTGGTLDTNPQYPSQFVLPDWTDYAGTVDQGIVSTSVSTAERSQEQVFNQAREQYSMTFTMVNNDYIYWIIWTQANAYKWFQMPIVSKQASVEVTGLQWVRFITDMAYAKIGDDLTSITVAAEVMTGNIGGINPDNRIIGGTPDAPATDRIIAGTPDAPSADRKIALLQFY